MELILCLGQHRSTCVLKDEVIVLEGFCEIVERNFNVDCVAAAIAPIQRDKIFIVENLLVLWPILVTLI